MIYRYIRFRFTLNRIYHIYFRVELKNVLNQGRRIQTLVNTICQRSLDPLFSKLLFKMGHDYFLLFPFFFQSTVCPRSLFHFCIDTL